jgi:hypothetical protein
MFQNFVLAGERHRPLRNPLSSSLPHGQGGIRLTHSRFETRASGARLMARDNNKMRRSDLVAVRNSSGAGMDTMIDSRALRSNARHDAGDAS